MSCIHEKRYGIRYGRGECPECAAILEAATEPARPKRDPYEDYDYWIPPAAPRAHGEKEGGGPCA